MYALLSQDNGIPSSMRAVMFGWHVPAVLVWTGLSIYHGHLEEIPNGVGFLLGGLTGLKVGQKFGEVQAMPQARGFDTPRPGVPPTTEDWGFIPTKPCRPERQLTCTHGRLLALRERGVDVFGCAYAWVDDASIIYEVRHGEDEDLLRPHSEITNRTSGIATMVRMMQRGVVFDPLFLLVGQHGGRLTRVHLRDGYHRLPAIQWQAVFGHGHPEISFNVGGELSTVRLFRERLGA